MPVTLSRAVGGRYTDQIVRREREKREKKKRKREERKKEREERAQRGLP